MKIEVEVQYFRRLSWCKICLRYTYGRSLLTLSSYAEIVQNDLVPGLKDSLEEALASMHSGDFMLQLLRWVLRFFTCSGRSINRNYVSALKEAELLLIAMSQLTDGEVSSQIEQECRNLYFLKLSVCGLVVPLNLGGACMSHLYGTISSMQSRHLHLSELGELLKSLWPAGQPWYVKAWRWAAGTASSKADLTMVRQFFSSTLAQSPGLEAEVNMAIYLALGHVSQADSESVRALQWLESCVGTSLLNFSSQIQLSRRLLSHEGIIATLDSVLEQETEKHGHRDHHVADVLVLACQEELESREEPLNDLRCRLTGLHAKGMDFIWAVAAGRIILVKAAKMVRSKEIDIEVSESALELFEVSSCPSRRAWEVFLVKNLGADRIELAQLKNRNQGDPAWRFLAFPAISDGLPSVSSLGHEICPSDCLLGIMSEEYTALKESILSSATVPPSSGDAAKVMAIFSTAFLGHYKPRNLPKAHEIIPQERSLRCLVEGMLQNFPNCPSWQIFGTSSPTPTTADRIFMMRPVIHMAAMCRSNQFWHQLFNSANQLKNHLLPFMPGDESAAALAVLGATERLGVYECSCGHRYTIGNCTQPWIQARCPGCGGQIGGRDHRPAAGNRLLSDAEWRRNAERPGFVDTRDEGSRQVWRSLTVDELRTGRFFFHGLLSLASALQRPKLCNLHLGHAIIVSHNAKKTIYVYIYTWTFRRVPNVS